MSKQYGIVYGGESRSDYRIDGGYSTAEEARAAYSPERRITYTDGLLGGAEIVELDSTGSPCRLVETLAEDEQPHGQN